MEREGLKVGKEVLAFRSFDLFGSLLQCDMWGGGRHFPSFTSPQSNTRDRQRLMEGEGGFASVPEEQTCVFFYTAT